MKFLVLICGLFMIVAAALAALGIAPIGQVPAIIAYLNVGFNFLNMAKEL